MAAIEVQMADPGFYNRSDSAKVTETYAGMRAALDAAMSEWESAQMELEALD